MISRLSATEASRNFSDVVNRVHYRREELIIERGGQPVCRIVPVAKRCSAKELAEILKEAPRPDAQFWEDVEAAIRKQGKPPKRKW